MKASSHLKLNRELSFSLTVFVCKVVTKSTFEILEMNVTGVTFCAHNKHAPQGMHEKMATFFLFTFWELQSLVSFESTSFPLSMGVGSKTITVV